MKQRSLRKLVSMILAVVMVLSMSITGFADTYSITISNSVKGVTYSFYKIFDAVYNSDYSGTTYYVTASSPWYSAIVNDPDSPFTLSASADSDGRYQVTAATTDASKITDWIAEVIENDTEGNITVTKEATGTGTSLTVTLDDAGYYYITTSIGTAVTLDSANPTATVIDKNTTSGGLNKTVGDNTVAIGDTVTYTVTANVPLYSDGSYDEVTKYTITDTLDAGLSLDDTSVSVTIKDANGEATDIVITPSINENTITVEFNPSTITGYPMNATIEITYSAKVLSTATNDTMGNHAVFGTDEVDVDLTTFDFNVYKYTVDEDGNDAELDGAEFELYEVVEGEQEENPIAFVEVYNETGEEPVLTGYRVAADEEIADDTITTTTTIVAGNVNIFGLDAGTYNLVETKAPDGYNLVTTATVVAIDEEGKVSVDGEETSDETARVLNNSGSTLPSTGGMGTTIFYIAGGVLVFVAAVLFVTRKRLGNEN